MGNVGSFALVPSIVALLLVPRIGLTQSAAPEVNLVHINFQAGGNRASVPSVVTTNIDPHEHFDDVDPWRANPGDWIAVRLPPATHTTQLRLTLTTTSTAADLRVHQRARILAVLHVAAGTRTAQTFQVDALGNFWVEVSGTTERAGQDGITYRSMELEEFDVLGAPPSGGASAGGMAPTLVALQSRRTAGMLEDGRAMLGRARTDCRVSALLSQDIDGMNAILVGVGRLQARWRDGDGVPAEVARLGRALVDTQQGINVGLRMGETMDHMQAHCGVPGVQFGFRTMPIREPARPRGGAGW